MKRKRGHKKGKNSKKSKSNTEQGNLNGSTENAENQTSEQSSDAQNSEPESKTEVDAAFSTGSGSSPIASSPVASSLDQGATSADKNMLATSVGRVKVKLKNSKATEPDGSSRNDISKSINPQAESKKFTVDVEKKEDLLPRLPERKPVFLNVYRKTKGIKIKSFKAVDESSSVTDKYADASKTHAEKVLQKDTKTPHEIPHVDKKGSESAPISFQKEEKITDQNSRYNKQELEDSLTVIKKMLKMDVSDPFNVPVNPEALEIPDYFDIIKTPMDFGTICNNLEKENKYKNSEDVYKDVQYIWNNCSKYTKKGDYIVDLMKRVKKNFMKYWTAAGLYAEKSAENAQLDGGKASSKGYLSKQKSHRRHGRQHKSDCMCAVCILKRRKRERELGSPGHSGAKEDSSPVGSPSMDNSSINMGEEQDMDIDVDNETGQGKSEIVELDCPVSEKRRVSETKQELEEEEEENLEVESENRIKTSVDDKTQSIDTFMEETGDEAVTSDAEKLAVSSSVEGPNEEEEKEKRFQEKKKLPELERKELRNTIQEKFQLRNPQILSLCEVVFPNNNNENSVWSGPHSLFKRSQIEVVPCTKQLRA